MKCLKFRNIDFHWTWYWYWKPKDYLIIVNWDNTAPPPPRAFSIFFLGFVFVTIHWEEVKE